MEPDLIAPCGMNCAICLAHLREKNKCFGCRAVKNSAPVTRVNCRIKNCPIIKKRKWTFCSTKCKEFPCQKLETLDKRYRTKYNMSMIENLKNIEANHINNFLKNEEHRWIKGNKVFCVHDKKYYNLT